MADYCKVYFVFKLHVVVVTFHSFEIVIERLMNSYKEILDAY